MKMVVKLGHALAVGCEYLARTVVLPMLALVGMLVLFAESARAQAVDLIPDAPVALEDYVLEGSTKMGVIVGTCIGVWFIYMLIRKGLRWARGCF